MCQIVSRYFRRYRAIWWKKFKCCVRFYDGDVYIENKTDSVLCVHMHLTTTSVYKHKNLSDCACFNQFHFCFERCSVDTCDNFVYKRYFFHVYRNSHCPIVNLFSVVNIDCSKTKSQIDKCVYDWLTLCNHVMTCWNTYIESPTFTVTCWFMTAVVLILPASINTSECVHYSYLQIIIGCSQS